MARTNEEIIEMADYYLNNKVTYKQAADHFGVCKKTYQLCIAKLQEISEKKYKLVQEKKEINLAEGAKKGGSVSKHQSPKVGRKSAVSDEDLNKISNLIIKRDYTIRQAEDITGISKSTIYENINKRISDDKRQKFVDVMESHKPGSRKK